LVTGYLVIQEGLKSHYAIKPQDEMFVSVSYKEQGSHEGQIPINVDFERAFEGYSRNVHIKFDINVLISLVHRVASLLHCILIVLNCHRTMTCCVRGQTI